MHHTIDHLVRRQIEADARELEAFLKEHQHTTTRVVRQLRQGWVGFDGTAIYRWQAGTPEEVVRRWEAGL